MRDLLDELARRIPYDNYEAFCYHLHNIDYNEAHQVLDQFRGDYRRALTKILQKWLAEKDRTRTELEDVLRAAKLGGLTHIVESHFQKGEHFDRCLQKLLYIIFHYFLMHQENIAAMELKCF